MDRIDRKIIDILQTNARAPLKEIADRVFLSSPAVSARIAKLEKDGVLTGYQAQVAPLKLGQLVKAFINLDMDPKLKPEFYPYIQSCGNVVECNCVTGDYSMLIEVLFGTTQELDTFINHLQQFGRTRTQIVFSTPGVRTTCLSLGERPVNWPVVQRNAPPLPRRPSPRCTAASTSEGSMKL